MPDPAGSGGRLTPLFSDEAADQIAGVPAFRKQIATRVRALCEPGGAEIGKPLTGELLHLRRVPIGRHYRLVYWNRGTDLLIVAVAKRGDDAVYRAAERSLVRGVPPKLKLTASNTPRPHPVSASAKPPARPKRKPKKKGRRR